MELRGDIRENIARRRQRSLVLDVRDELERMIFEGEVKAGERLNEIGLAEQLGVSRGPVREAARSLEREGLVTNIANQGVFVRELAVEDALELYDLRAMIAGYLCGLAAKHVDPALSAQLRDLVAEMEVAIGKIDEGRYFDLNLAFHDRIAEAAGAYRARALYTSLGKEVRLMRIRVLTGRDSLALSNAEHAQIVAAIESGDSDEARTNGALHHVNGKKRLLETL